MNWMKKLALIVAQIRANNYFLKERFLPLLFVYVQILFIHKSSRWNLYSNEG